MVDGVQRYGYSGGNPVKRLDGNGYLGGTEEQYDRYAAAMAELARESTREMRNVPKLDSKGEQVTTLVLGGAGYESGSATYMPDIAEAIRQSGVKGVAYLPISHPQPMIQQAANVSSVLRFRDAPVPADDGSTGTLFPAILHRVRSAFSPAASERNIVGYSYGTVVGAQAAIAMANDGMRVDNLILVGSPIEPTSDLARNLETHPNIGRVVWLDIAGDPLSGGIDPWRAVTDNGRHFVFAGADDDDTPDPHQAQLGAIVGHIFRDGPAVGRFTVPPEWIDSQEEFLRSQPLFESDATDYVPPTQKSPR